MSKMTICLWFDRGQVHFREAAEFYARVFPDSNVGEGHASAADNPSAKEGEELTVEFTVLGQACIGLNGGTDFKPTGAVSFMILTENQGRHRSLLERDRRQWRRGEPVRLVQGSLGLLLADHAAGCSRRRTTRIAPPQTPNGNNVDDEEDRHRHDRGRARRGEGR